MSYSPPRDQGTFIPKAGKILYPVLPSQEAEHKTYNSSVQGLTDISDISDWVMLVQTDGNKTLCQHFTLRADFISLCQNVFLLRVKAIFAALWTTVCTVHTLS